MKTIKNTLVIVFAFALVSFTTSIIKKDVKVKDSKITWTGHKLTGKHEGTIGLKQGTLSFEGEKLVSANFTIDMTSINTTDMDGENKANLDGHLKSPEFFDVKNHPTASFKTTSVKGKDGKYDVTGEMTIKGLTSTISFKMEVGDKNATAN